MAEACVYVPKFFLVHTHVASCVRQADMQMQLSAHGSDNATKRKENHNRNTRNPPVQQGGYWQPCMESGQGAGVTAGGDTIPCQMQVDTQPNRPDSTRAREFVSVQLNPSDNSTRNAITSTDCPWRCQ